MKNFRCILVCVLLLMGLAHAANTSSALCHRTADATGGADSSAVKVTPSAGAQTVDFTFNTEFKITDTCDGKVLVKISSPPIPGITVISLDYLTIDQCVQRNPDSSTRVSSVAQLVETKDVDSTWGNLPNWPDRDINIYFTLDLYEFSARAPAQIRCTLAYFGIPFYAEFQLDITGCPVGRYGSRCDHACPCGPGAVCHTFTGVCSAPGGCFGSGCEPVPAYVESEMTPTEPDFGGAVTFTCELHPLETQTISDYQWLFNGSPTLPPGSHTYYRDLPTGQKYVGLQFPRVTREHEGTITCILTSSSGQQLNKTRSITLPNEAVKVSVLAESQAYDFSIYTEFKINNTCEGQMLVKVTSPPVLGIKEIFLGLMIIDNCQQLNTDSSTRVSPEALVIAPTNVTRVWGSHPSWPDRDINVYFMLYLYEFSAQVPMEISCGLKYVAVNLNAEFKLDVLGCHVGQYGSNCEHTCPCGPGVECHTFTGACCIDDGCFGAICHPGAAHVVSQMSPAEPSFGDPVNITCDLQPPGTKSVASQQWFFNGSTTLPPGSQIYHGEGPNGQKYGVLQLPRVTNKQEGEVKCVMTSSFGKNVSKTHSTTLTGCPAGFFGLYCDEPCHCSSWEVCERFHGCVCPQDDVNCTIWHEPPVCVDGFYGLHCDLLCDCSGSDGCDRLLGCACPDCVAVVVAPVLPWAGLWVAAGLGLAMLLLVLLVVGLIMLGRRRGWGLCAWSTETEFVNKYYQQYAEERQRSLDILQVHLPGSPDGAANDEKSQSRSAVALLDKLHVEETDIYFGGLLGEGAFSRVYHGRLMWKHNLPVALKMVKNGNDEFAKRDLMSEFETLADLCPHPNIVQLLGVSMVSDTGSGPGCLTLVVEYMEQGSLLDWLKKTKEKLATCNDVKSMPSKTFLKFVTDIAAGMLHMSSKKLIHRDLATRNVLISSQLVAKIADFGLSRDCYLQEMYKKDPNAGKMLPWFWMAPESMMDNDYTTKSDVWSFGVLLWEICTLGEMPYPGLAPEQVNEYLLLGNRLPTPAGCPLEWEKLMQQCWYYDPNSRPNFNTLHKEFQTMLSSNKGIPEFPTDVPLVITIDNGLGDSNQTTAQTNNDPYLDPNVGVVSATSLPSHDGGYLNPGFEMQEMQPKPDAVTSGDNPNLPEERRSSSPGYSSGFQSGDEGVLEEDVIPSKQSSYTAEPVMHVAKSEVSVSDVELPEQSVPDLEGTIPQQNCKSELEMLAAKEPETTKRTSLMEPASSQLQEEDTISRHHDLTPNDNTTPSTEDTITVHHDVTPTSGSDVTAPSTEDISTTDQDAIPTTSDDITAPSTEDTSLAQGDVTPTNSDDVTPANSDDVTTSAEEATNSKKESPYEKLVFGRPPSQTKLPLPSQHDSDSDSSDGSNSM